MQKPIIQHYILLQYIMFSICKTTPSQLQVSLETITPCEKHDESMNWICLNEECRDECLLCMQCISSHKNHDLESLNKYLTAELKETLEEGRSKHGKQVLQMKEAVELKIQQLKCRVNDKINELQLNIKSKMQKLASRYPHNQPYPFTGSTLNSNIQQIIDIVQRQNNSQWIKPTQELHMSILTQTKTSISNLIDDVFKELDRDSWEDLGEAEAQIQMDQFYKRYHLVFELDEKYWRFSAEEKHGGVKLSEDLLQATFHKSNPSKPSVLTVKPLTRDHPKIYFEVTKYEKTALVFDLSFIGIGVCLPKKAKMNSFRQLMDATKGGYMIGSTGKSYHSTNPEYQMKPIAFSFGVGDVVSVELDYDEGLVKFWKKGFFQKKFQMPLDLTEQNLLKLKPCVVFHGEAGAKIRIIGEQLS